MAKERRIWGLEDGPAATPPRTGPLSGTVVMDALVSYRAKLRESSSCNDKDARFRGGVGGGSARMRGFYGKRGWRSSR